MGKHDGTGNITRLMVTWKVDGQERQTPVALEEGYTTEQDIPKILAIARLGSDRRAVDIEVLEVEEITQ